MKTGKLLFRGAMVSVLVSLAAIHVGSETLTGTVTEQGVGTPIPNAVITVVQLGSSAVTNASGQYAFGDLPGNSSYTVTAQAAGFITETKTVWIGGTPNQPPTINLTSPVSGSTYTAPATIALAATASDPDGSVVSVRFYRGTTLLNTDTTSPYEYTWANVSTGTYQLRAVAQDNWGATSTSTIVTVTVVSSGVPNQPPVVNLTSPVNGSTYTAPATVNLAATASDSDGSIASVRFYSGTTLLNTDTSSPYTYSWTGVGAGSYALRAVAQDNQGATSTSTVVNITVYSSGTPVNQPPTVNLTSPVNGSTYTAPATIALAATASDPDGTVVNVRFYQGNTLIGTATSAPYEGAWLGVSAGTYQLRAVAIDDLGATSTSTVVTVTVLSSGTPAVWYTLTTAVNPANGGTVSPASGTYLAGSQIQVTATPNANYTFANWSGDASGTNPTVTITMDANKSITANFTYVSPANSSPTVSITGPANGATFSAPASITITATATDIDGTIAVVRFYSGASQIAQINASPYQYTWTNVPAGNYVLTARAEDNLGATGISAAVSITVNEGVRPPDDVSPGEVRIGGSQDGYFNPLLGQAQIAFRLKTAGVVKVRVYGLRGQLVWEDSVSGAANETKTRLWDGRDKSGASVASGVYIVQVTGGGIDARKKLAVVAQ